MIVTSAVASVFGLLYLVLAQHVISRRRKYKVSVGHGDVEELHRSIRAHSNLAEYAPIILILLAAYEVNDGPLVIAVILGAIAMLGRLLHARGMTLPADARIKLRVPGMALTLSAIAGLVLSNIFLVAGTLFLS
ncbi:MAG: MAPEG family protein [Gammaproteobacteria bacterium]|nr:MAPEG family protein [Gammaproteobacteria bacterium]